MGSSLSNEDEMFTVINSRNEFPISKFIFLDEAKRKPVIFFWPLFYVIRLLNRTEATKT